MPNAALFEAPSFKYEQFWPFGDCPLLAGKRAKQTFVMRSQSNDDRSRPFNIGIRVYASGADILQRSDLAIRMRCLNQACERKAFGHSVFTGVQREY